MNLLRREFRVWCAAVMFFTRIRVPVADLGAEELAAAPRYFPLVGILVGAIGAGVWWLSSRVLPGEIAVVLSIVATVLTTGAFHEDAFADVCDGFGGGHDKVRILAIMKDSRVGAFGVIGIALLLGLKVLALIHVPTRRMVAVMIAGHAVSRWAALTVMATQSYVRDDAESKSRPLTKPFGAGTLLVGSVCGLLPVFTLPMRLWPALAIVVVARWWLGRWFLRRIGGYTGDCLGAVQQVGEVVFYLAVVALSSW